MCEHVVAHVKKAGLNVQDFVPQYQTASAWTNQYEVLRIEQKRFPDLYQGRKERPNDLLARSKLKPPMVDVRNTDLKHYFNNTREF